MSAYAQEGTVNVVAIEENKNITKESVEDNKISNLDVTGWIVGATKTSTTKKENTNKPMSKKEQFSQFGASTKTLLIRSLIKKANSYTQALV